MKRANRDEVIAKKMHAIAEIVDDLNKAKNVKCGAQNDFGYATIQKIAIGCNVRVHHMLDNSLSLDLLISPTAENKYQIKCETTKLKFKQLFSGNTSEDLEFIIHSRKNETHYRLWVDITKVDIDEIFLMVQNIKTKLGFQHEIR